MLWVSVGLFCLGVACGAVIRLMIFIGVLLGAAAITVAVTVGHGIGAALLTAVLTVVVLQVGYAAGLILRAAGRSLFAQASTSGTGKQPVVAPFGGKRR
jgi:hypothetical protein